MWTGQGKASRDGLKQAVLCGQRCDCAMDGVRRGGQLRVYSPRVRCIHSAQAALRAACRVSVLKGLASLARGGVILYVILLIPKLSYMYVICIPHVGTRAAGRAQRLSGVGG